MAPPFEMTSTSLAVTPSVGVPGEAAGLHASWNQATSRVDVTFAPACDSTSYTVHWGALSGVSTYAYTGAQCGVAPGSASFDPGPDSVFFLVVANNGANEGSYGTSLPQGGPPTERPPRLGTPGCDYPQDLAGVTCE
jgi:hypothetical protein